jgi:hypothetical protein
MRFETPRRDLAFEIDDDWWLFAEMDQFSLNDGGGYFPYKAACDANVEIVLIADIQPPERAPGVASFKKYKLVPVLLAFRSPECSLPPVSVAKNSEGSPYPYRLTNGFHRYFASAAVGYTSIPALIHEPSVP